METVHLNASLADSTELKPELDSFADIDAALKGNICKSTLQTASKLVVVCLSEQKVQF